MKKIILIFLFFPLLAHAQWYQLDSITDQSLNAVSFTDENTGYVAGENGTLFKTTNAGENWFQLELNTDYNITDMCFPAVDTGYIICNKQDFNGERFKIYKTVNGGTYWTEQDSLIGSDSTGFLNGIDFLDTNTGIAVGRVGTGVAGGDFWIPQILYTKNGGTTWQFFNLHVYFNNYEDNINYVYLNDVAIYDSTHAISVGLGDAYHTFEFADDTIIWNCLYEGESGMSNELFSVCFANENTVFTGGQEGEVYKIINNDFQNRITYQVDNIHSPFITSIVFPTQSIGYINNLYKTIDFGETWSFQPYPFNPVGISSALNDMFFLNENTGYAVGSYGLMLKTMNGGVFINSELLSTNVDIYPNPADDFVYITTDLSQHGTFMFNILDINGKIVKHGVIDDKHKKISISNIKSGRYVVKLITSKGEIICKSFVKL
jgi:photosystem II stability/assembly factor-like uncharacterized protein